MENKWSEQDLVQIASQLSCPEGEEGIKTGERMARTNDHMTQQAFKALDILPNERILEIGPGNANHLKDLMALAASLHYYGIDVSETMVAAASELNAAIMEKETVSFQLTPADEIEFSSNFFDKIFTVNTLYFWLDPEKYAAEILRVLKPGGIFSLAFATRDFMEQLPFTKYKFKLYDKEVVEGLLKNAGFEVIAIKELKDSTTSNTGIPVIRDIVIALARKKNPA